MNNTVNLVVIFVVSLVIAFAFGKCANDDSAMKAYQAKFDKYQITTVAPILKSDSVLKDSVKKVMALNDSLTKKSNEKGNQIDKLQKSIVALGKQNKHSIDSIFTAAPADCGHALALVDSIHTKMEDSLVAENTLWRQKDSVDVQISKLWMATSAKFAAHDDSLANVIKKFPKPETSSSKILGFIPKPNKTEAFLFGIAVDETIRAIWNNNHRK